MDTVPNTASGRCLCGDLRFDARGNTERASLKSLQARMPTGTLDARGDVAWAPSLRWAMSADLAGFDPGYFLPDYPGRLDGEMRLQAAQDAGLDVAALQQDSPRRHEWPFDAERKRMRIALLVSLLLHALLLSLTFGGQGVALGRQGRDGVEVGGDARAGELRRQPAGQGPGELGHIGLGVSGVGPDRVELQDLPRQILVQPGTLPPSAERAPEYVGDIPDLPQPGDPDDPESLGDIAIAWETCAREAEAQGKPMADHVTHLIVHGVLHLLGYDHIEEEDAAVMEALEVQILASLGVSDPY